MGRPMLFDDLTIQRSGKALAKSFTGGAPQPVAKRAPRVLPARDTGEAFQGPIDPRKVTRFVAGYAQDHDYLTRKKGGAIGMKEGWREITEEPVRQRVGLLGMSY